jgi:hypothetical protein
VVRLLLLDAVIYVRRGRSFVGGRRRKLLAMMLWSIRSGSSSEAYKLRLCNWYHIVGLRSLWGATMMTALAFAAVLPALFFPAEPLEAFGAFRNEPATNRAGGSPRLRLSQPRVKSFRPRRCFIKPVLLESGSFRPLTDPRYVGTCHGKFLKELDDG